MYRLENITIKNWLSIEHINYKRQDGVKLVEGVNLTDKGARSNGSGKSSFEESLFFSLTGTSLRKVTKNELVRDSSDGSTLTSTWYNPVTNTTLEIERNLSVRGKEVLSFAINGVEAEFDTIPNANKMILSEIGLSKEQLQSYFLLSRERYLSFFRSPESEKRELVGKFSNANIIKKAYPVAEENIEAWAELIRDIEKQILTVETRLEVLKEELENDTEAAFEERKKDRLSQLKDTIQAHLTKIKNAENSIEEKRNHLLYIAAETAAAKKFLPVLKATIEKLTCYGESYKDAMKDGELLIDKNQAAIVKLKEANRVDYKEISELDVLINNIEAKIEGSIECPSCKHKFVLGDDLPIEEMKSHITLFGDNAKTLRIGIAGRNLEIGALEDGILRVSKELTPLKYQLNRSRDIYVRVSGFLQSKETEISRLGRLERTTSYEIDNLRDKIKQSSSTIKDTESTIKTIEETEFMPNKDRLEAIKLAEAHLKKHKQRKLDSEEEALMEKESLLSLNNFYIHTLNTSLSYIQKTVNTFLEDFGTNLSIVLEGFKEKRSGGYSEKITPYVYRDGVLAGGYEKLSSGEKAKLELAQILANQAIINNSLQKGEGLDLLYIDEILDSVDGEGISSLIEAVSNTKRNIFIVTHITHEGVDTARLTFIKENHITRLEVENG